MAKGEGSKDEQSVPASFAETTPPPHAGTDLSMWLLNAQNHNTETLGKVEGTLTSLQAQINRVETKVDDIKAEVKGHGNWVHTVKYVLSGFGVLLAWVIAYVIGPWVKSKLFGGTP